MTTETENNTTTSSKFNAVLVTLEDKRVIQDLRLQYRLPEKLMMTAILKAVASTPDILAQCAADALANKPPRRKRLKKTEATETVETTSV